jgi:hypothetical protein
MHWQMKTFSLFLLIGHHRFSSSLFLVQYRRTMQANEADFYSEVPP